MSEDFLYFLWKFQMVELSKLFTVNDEEIQVIHPGYRNINSGPDFFNSHLVINGQEWAGNVEMHIKSSDWLLHGHSEDPAFDNVVLHVVWQHDKDIFHRDGSLIPVLELKDKTPDSLLQSYSRILLNTPKFIYCENDFGKVPDFVFNNWLQKLFIERLEQKSNLVYKELDKTNGNWEAVLFRLLSKSFGTKVNSDSFLSIASSLDFKLIQKLAHSEIHLKALLLGRAGLIDKIENNAGLKSEYRYLQHKFKLGDYPIVEPKYFRLRPNNFPHLRLLQLAELYSKNTGIFQMLIQTDNLTDVIGLLKSCGITETFAEHLIINAIIPVKFCYHKTINREVDDVVINWVEQLQLEKNSIIQNFSKLKNIEANALNSQSLLQLKNNYCIRKKCLNCEIGHYLVFL